MRRRTDRRCPLGKELTCACCGTTEDDVRLESSRTAYAFVPPRLTRYERILEENFGEELPDSEDPNADIPLCRGCAEDHHKNWNERWAEYYAGLL
jgi:hypothetical protein